KYTSPVGDGRNLPLTRTAEREMSPEENPRELFGRKTNMSASDDLTKAIAQLAIAELVFTSEDRSDGKNIYVVDSVAFTEDELILLHKKGALTLNGIRHYLVDRAA